jgi:hypothetical protein
MRGKKPPKRKTSSDSDEFVSLGGPLLSVMLDRLLADFPSVKEDI